MRRDKDARVLLLATLAALAAIGFGALFLIAPVWQPGYTTRATMSVSEAAQRTERQDAAPAEEQGEPVNINTATLEELMTLPGIGEAKGRAILAYREEHGAFVYPEELRNVKGIGEKRLQAILDALAGESAEESD